MLLILAWAIRLAFIPLALAAPPAWPVVAVGALVALAPVLIDRVVTVLPATVHLGLAAGALVESAGRALHLYEGHPFPYDLLAHAVEVGAAVGIMVDLGRRRFRAAELGWIGVVVLCAGVGVALGVAWEVVEGALDSRIAATLQHGVDDTLQDIVAGTVGAALVGSALPRYWASRRVDGRQ